MPAASYKIFGTISGVLALLIAAAVFAVVTHFGTLDVRKSATADAQTVVAITNGFVRTYSDYQSRFAKGQLPNPARFRAEALHKADQSILEKGGATSVVGLPGREIVNAPIDEQMRLQLLKLENNPELEVLESVYSDKTKTTHRTLVPFFASEPTCAECHNRLQNLSGDERWTVGDLMGAQYVDQNISPQLAKLTRSVWTIAVLAFLTMIAGSYCFLFLFKQFQLRKELEQLATTDSMTGCINRREMYARINNLTGEVNGVLLMLDLDRFKHINDTHGHAAGDAIIQDFSTRIKNAIRGDDWVARIGGEEFAVWLHNLKPASALVVAERLRKEIESSPVVFNNVSIDYTVSIGMHIVVDESAAKFDQWLKAADEHLYRAKNDGRNQIVYQKALMA